MEKSIYLDYAATTPVDEQVLEAMQRCLGASGPFANPASGHAAGLAARSLVEQARGQVADLIHADAAEIIWTSGATEADNLALIGAAHFRRGRGQHIITALTEHPAVLGSCQYLESEGFDVTYLRPDEEGLVQPEAVRAAIRGDTVLVSIMHVNNEIGVVQDIASIGHICRERDVLFHVDAAQSTGRERIHVREQCIDLLSMSAHKIHGPKGVGALFLERDRIRRVEPILHGGGQERALRPGTVATHQVVGMGTAYALAEARMSSDRVYVNQLREHLWRKISKIPGVFLNGHPEQRVCHILSVSVTGVEGESLLHGLGGLVVSSGSACASDSDEPSQVLRSLGRPDHLARSTVRFSLGRHTREEEIDFAAECFTSVIDKLRAMAPPTGKSQHAKTSSDDAGFRGEAGSEELGTRVVFKGRADDGRIAELSFKVYGCPHTVSACQLVAGRLKGQRLSSLPEIEPGELAQELDLPREKMGRLLIVQDALRNCLADWENRTL
jgi:cysteine desulfurase